MGPARLHAVLFQGPILHSCLSVVGFNDMTVEAHIPRGRGIGAPFIPKILKARKVDH